MELPIFSLLLANLAILAGAVFQASTGMGAGFFVIPLLALISLQLVPGPAILASALLALLMMLRDRGHILYTLLDKVILGLLLGAFVAYLFLTAIPADKMGLLFGVIILVAVLISATGRDIPMTRWSAFLSGALSGFMGTVSGIGAPVLALLYQRQAGPAIRSTLGLIYFVSCFIILFALAKAHRFGWVELWLGCALLPGYILGFHLSTPLARHLDQGYTRLAVLIIAALCALLLIIRSL